MMLVGVWAGSQSLIGKTADQEIAMMFCKNARGKSNSPRAFT
jgi:hypothetical protein